jgi:hypothetical protein
MPCSLRNTRGLLYPPAARSDYCAHAGRRRTTRPLREKLGQAGRTQGWVAAGSSTQNRLPWPGSESRHTAPPIRCIAVRTIASPMPVPGCLSSWCSRLSMSKICCCRSLGMPMPLSSTQVRALAPFWVGDATPDRLCLRCFGNDGWTFAGAAWERTACRRRGGMNQSLPGSPEETTITMESRSSSYATSVARLIVSRWSARSRSRTQFLGPA